MSVTSPLPESRNLGRLTQSKTRRMLLQFLFEALALSGAGGLAGLVIGALIALAVNLTGLLTVALSWDVALLLEAMPDASLAPTTARFTAMHEETQVLLRLVEDLHTLSLTDAGELVLRLQPTDPAVLLSRVAQTYHDTAEQARIELRVTTAPALPTPQLDSEQIVRALGNLASNALRYTPTGGQVTLGAQAEAATLLLWVSDTGPGIPAEHLPNLFERFYRTDESRQQASGGSGLGLAIVRSIVQAHGGAVTVESELGVGTTFRVFLPG